MELVMEGSMAPEQSLRMHKNAFFIVTTYIWREHSKDFCSGILTRVKYSFKATKGKIKNGINSFSFPLNHYYIFLVFRLFPFFFA